MKIAITGHRPSKLGNDYDLTSPLIGRIKERILEELALNVPEGEDMIFITGMALGIDTLFAKIAVELGIPFIAAIPNTLQARLWPKKSVEVWRELLNKAAQVVDVSGGASSYHIHHLQKRNEWMVNTCDILIAVWDESHGGTANCVEYAKSKEKKIIYINPKTII